MRRPCLASLLIIALAIPGCGRSPRIDVSSKDNLQASMKRMTAGMTEDQRKQFGEDCAILVFPAMKEAASRGEFRKGNPAPSDPTPVFKSLDGMTAGQIHEKAELARHGTRKP